MTQIIKDHENIESFWNNMNRNERLIFAKDLECTRDYRKFSLLDYSELLSIEKRLLKARYTIKRIDHEKELVNELFDQFLKVQLNGMEGVKFGDVNILSRDSLYSIALDIVQQYNEKRGGN